MAPATCCSVTPGRITFHAARCASIEASTAFWIVCNLARRFDRSQAREPAADVAHVLAPAHLLQAREQALRGVAVTAGAAGQQAVESLALFQQHARLRLHRGAEQDFIDAQFARVVDAEPRTQPFRGVRVGLRGRTGFPCTAAGRSRGGGDGQGGAGLVVSGEVVEMAFLAEARIPRPAFVFVVAENDDQAAADGFGERPPPLGIDCRRLAFPGPPPAQARPAPAETSGAADSRFSIGGAQPRRRRAALTVLTISMATVSGPTPPGTGV